MTKVKKEQVIEDLRSLFEIGEMVEGNMSMEADGEFQIDKRKFERDEVIDMLLDYFCDKVVENGYVKIDSITFLFTTFWVKTGKPE